MRASLPHIFRCCCFLRRCLKTCWPCWSHPASEARVYAIVRASTGGGLIKEPDQAKGFLEHIMTCIVIAILRELIIGTGGILTDKDAILERHPLPGPPARVTGLTGRKEAVHLDDLAASLLDLRLKQALEGSQRGIGERASQPSVFEQSLEVQGLHPDDPVTVCQPGGQFLQRILAQTGNPVMQPCNLSARFLPILRSRFPA